MTGVEIALGLLLKYGPEVYRQARLLLAKKDLPTDAEWAELDAILEKTGESYFAGPKVTP
jgi:hypothetical protein